MSSESIEQPAWLKNYHSSKKAGRADWKPGMKSPNPAGRPLGIIDKRTKITRALMDDAQGIVRVVINAALEGDIQAANIVLSRITPVLKARSENVTFQLDEAASLSIQAQQIMKAVSNGDLDPDTGKMLLDCLGTVYGIRQIDEFATRLAKLEKSMRVTT